MQYLKERNASESRPARKIGICEKGVWCPISENVSLDFLGIVNLQHNSGTNALERWLGCREGLNGSGRPYMRKENKAHLPHNNSRC